MAVNVGFIIIYHPFSSFLAIQVLDAGYSPVPSNTCFVLDAGYSPMPSKHLFYFIYCSIFKIIIMGRLSLNKLLCHTLQ